MARELIEPHKGDKRYIRRGRNGQFTDKQVDVGQSLSADRRSKAKTVAKRGKDAGEIAYVNTARYDEGHLFGY